MTGLKTIRLGDLALVTELSREAIRNDIARNVVPWDESSFVEGQQRRFDGSHVLAIRLSKLLVAQGITADVAAAPLRDLFGEVRDWLIKKERGSPSENLNIAVFSTYEYEQGEGVFWKTSFMIGKPKEIEKKFAVKLREFGKFKEVQDLTVENFYDQALGSMRVNIVSLNLAYKDAQNRANTNGFELQSLNIGVASGSAKQGKP